MFENVFDRKKLNFWRLAFIFAGLVVIILFLLWNSPREPKAQMMDGSMGNMMKQTHLSNITLYDLMSIGEMHNGTQSQPGEMDSHHQNSGETVFKLSFLTTATIFLLLPFIIGGAVILAIVWIK